LTPLHCTAEHASLCLLVLSFRGLSPRTPRRFKKADKFYKNSPNTLTTGEFYVIMLVKGGDYMAEVASLNIKIDRDLKMQADNLFNRMGMNLTTAVNVFVRQAVQEQAIPFKIYVEDEKTVLLKAKLALKEMQEESAKNGNSEMTLDEINDIIAETREEKRALNAKNSN
jgi:DNA-damage-inducible protein J